MCRTSPPAGGFPGRRAGLSLRLRWSVSTYPFWLFSFDLREDLEPHVLAVLAAVGRGDSPNPGDLDRLPQVPRHYLAQPRRMQGDQGEPVAGTPIRIAHSGIGGWLTLTIEFAQHGNEYANGGWLFWMWVVSLARRPPSGEGRDVLGYHGMYRGDYDSQVVYIDATGVTENGVLVPFTEIDAVLADEQYNDLDGY